MVAHELHKNGDHHIHACLKLEEVFEASNPDFADLLFDGETYHGNYQACRSFKNVVKYCTKEEDYLSNLDVGELIKGKSTREAIATKLIKDKVPLAELLTEVPSLIYDYKKLKLNMEDAHVDSLPFEE